MTSRAPEKPPVVELKSSAEAKPLGCACGRTCGDNGGVKTNNEPCESRIHERDCRCFSHAATRSDAERQEAWRRGGLATTMLSEAEVPEVPLRTRTEVAKARERVFQLVRARQISAPVGQTLLSALRDADAQRDRAEVLALDRKGRRPSQHVLHVRLEPWVGELAAAHRAHAGVGLALPGVKRVGPTSRTPR